MLEMEYDTDTLTAASKNRAASKKIFQQLQHSSRSLHASPPVDALQQLAMLHRTPSGAQKKIRQRQEQRWLKATSSSSFEQPPSECDGGYRSLIDSGAYQSILPDEPGLPLSPAPPHPPPRSAASLTSSTSPQSSLNSSMNSTSSMCSVPSASIMGGKPTVEVHPMPSQQQCGDSVTPSWVPSAEFGSAKLREKPAVPKKPPKLALAMTRIETPPSSSPQPLSVNTSMSVPSTPSQTSPSLNRLFSTPSLMSLHAALMQPALTEEEIERLDAKRKKLIESISRKVSVLDEERLVLEEEIEANEIFRRTVCEDLHLTGDSAIVQKLEKNLAHCLQLIKLETRLRMRLERLEASSCVSGESGEKEAATEKVDRLRMQLDDHALLKKNFERRDALLDSRLCSILCDERSTQWRFYKDAWKKLMAERQEIEERLHFGREQLVALQNVQPGVGI